MVPQKNRLRLPICAVCDEEVALETCKADEYGNAIHEECAVIHELNRIRLVPSKKNQSTKTENKKVLE